MILMVGLFILMAYQDYDKSNTLTKKEFIEIIQLTESYLLRRIIAGFKGIN